MAEPMNDIEWAVKETKARVPLITLHQEYYRGQHRAAFSTETWETAFGRVFRGFRDNLCPAVVDTKADRLQISGFETGEDSSDQKVRDIWQANRMDRRAGELHQGSLRDGDSFAIIWPDKTGQPVFYPQRSERMCVRYSEDTPGLIEVASKLWPAEPWAEKSKWRLSLYYADRIERYITTTSLDGRHPDVPDAAGSWVEYTEAESPDDPLRGWTLKNPYEQVPVFVWPNNAMTGEYGRSELADVVPLQDALNKTVADSLIAGEFAALPQRWATGLEVPVGPDGEPNEKPFEAGIDRIWANANPQGQFGQFEPANMAGFVATADGFRAEIARVSRTPLHYLLLSGQFPSGEALRAAEAPLMAVIKDRQATFGNTWEDAIAFALKVAGQQVESVSCTWLDTTSVSDSEKLDAMTKKKDLGIPDETLWKEMGYDEDQIEEFTAAADLRREQAAAAFAGGTPDNLTQQAGQDASAEAIGRSIGA